MSDDDLILDDLLAASNEDNLLDTLLSAATSTEENEQSKPILKETNIFENESNSNNLKNSGKSLIHSGDTDSSDDEDNRNYQDRKYNESGREIKRLLETKSTSQREEQRNNNSSWTKKSHTFGLPSKSPTLSKTKKVSDVYSDPIFGMRIINPLISSAMLQERMVGREAVPFSRICKFLQTHTKDKDWVIAGAVASKSPVRTSQRGSQFSIWTLTDLKTEIKTVSLFLFSNAHKQLWKTSVGTVIGILNPNVIDKKDGSKDEACLSVDNAQKVMIFGQSKDLGTCKSKKKNGEQCNAIVNVNMCEFCLYHIKQEYQKCSLRSDLQANFAGRGLTALRNKVLGKNEVFYAGKSYMAIPAKKSRKLQKKDESRLQSLNGLSVSSNNITKAKNIRKRKEAASLEISQAQRMRDIEVLKKLGGCTGIETKTNFSGQRSSEVKIEESKMNAANIINKLKAKRSETEFPPKKNAQFNLKSDLIINVEQKNKFESKLSNEVSLEESREAAKSVISKLKLKHVSTKESEITNVNSSEINDMFTNDDIFGDDDFNINYDDVDFDTVSGVSQDNSKNSLKLDVKIDNENKAAGSNRNMKTSTEPKSLLKVDTLKITSDEASISKNYTTCQNKSNTPKVSKPNQDIILKPTLDIPTKKSKDALAMSIPMLSDFGAGFIDLNKPITSKHVDRAKQNAIKLIQRNGPIKKSDPNNTRGSGKKRLMENAFETENKKVKIENSEFVSDRFKKMMAMTSKHMDLLSQREDEEQEKYFNKLEVKEKMEEKMTNTFKVACKAVTCTVCKYTNFSASDLCKKEGHKLKVSDAMKRFFKCGNCQNRTASLHIIPLKPCTNCGSKKWEKTGMMKEKIVKPDHNLSIRGGEQTFINSVATNANVDLMVPE